MALKKVGYNVVAWLRLIELLINERLVNTWTIAEQFPANPYHKKKKRAPAIKCGLHNVVYGSNENFCPK
jgi:hypothetical protein